MGKKFGMAEIFTILKKHLVIIIAVFILAGTASMVFFGNYVDKTYRSTISVYICKKGEIDYSDALMSKEISTDAVVILSASDDYLSDEYCVFSGTNIPESKTPFADLEKKGYTKNVIKSMLKYEVVKNTGVISISVFAKDKETTKEIGDALSHSVATYLQDTIYGIQAKLVSGAKIGVVAGPAVLRNSVIIAIIAAGLTYCIFTLAFILDNRVRDNETFRNKLDVPFLGEIPKVTLSKNNQSEGGTQESYNTKALSFRFFETFKSIRTSLFYVIPKLKNNVFAVTSPGAREGKSTISYHLSMSMAEANVKVLVIDADLRNPTISKHFDLDNKTGLANILNNDCKFEDAVCKDVKTGLDVLLSGPIPKNPSELLSSDNLQNLLDYVKGKYDFVIVDTAPINLVTDSLLFMDKIAGTILVSRYGVTSYNDIKKSIESIDSVNGTIIGAIINDVVVPNKAYSYKKYYKYNKYRY